MKANKGVSNDRKEEESSDATAFSRRIHVYLNKNRGYLSIFFCHSFLVLSLISRFKGIGGSGRTTAEGLGAPHAKHMS